MGSSFTQHKSDRKSYKKTIEWLVNTASMTLMQLNLPFFYQVKVLSDSNSFL